MQLTAMPGVAWRHDRSRPSPREQDMANEVWNEPGATTWPGTDTEAGRKARELGNSAADAARTASAKVQGAGAAAVDTLTDAASTARQKASEYADAAARRISATADYVRHSDADRIKGDVETLVKNHPGPAMIAAAAVGFLLGRALSRD
jgi:ElaB/YqjD/DUF883 family membrane-anchored ribosome-binding protein